MSESKSPRSRFSSLIGLTRRTTHRICRPLLTLFFSFLLRLLCGDSSLNRHVLSQLGVSLAFFIYLLFFFLFFFAHTSTSRSSQPKCQISFHFSSTEVASSPKCERLPRCRQEEGEYAARFFFFLFSADAQEIIVKNDNEKTNWGKRSVVIILRLCNVLLIPPASECASEFAEPSFEARLFQVFTSRLNRTMEQPPPSFGIETAAHPLVSFVRISKRQQQQWC